MALGRQGGRQVDLMLLATACNPSNLYIAHDTVIGVNAAVNTERTSGRSVIGYDRDFVTVVPISVNVAEGKEAMAVLSCSEMEVNNIGSIRKP